MFLCVLCVFLSDPTKKLNLAPYLFFSKDWIAQRYSDGLPITDKDRDNFSASNRYFPRTQHWRGVDCNDNERLGGADIYPGRNSKYNDWDGGRDSNCNQILGDDPETNQPYEQKFCQNQDNIGTMILGDSASAHFHLPQTYFEPETWSTDNTTFRNVLGLVIDEGDFPSVSWGTGYENIQNYAGIEFIDEGNQIPDVTSIYGYLLNHNKCNYNDYQNGAMNGRKAKTIYEHIAVATRNATFDNPVIAVVSSVGNDVCGKSADLDRMTSPEEFYYYTNKTLAHLNELLPPTSEVYISSVADGRVLYNAMHDRIHPLGKYRKNMKFGDLYNMLNCIETTPCRGWLNKDKDIRDATSNRAAELSKAAQVVVRDAAQYYENIRVFYYEFDLVSQVNTWLSRGGSGSYQIVDPTDGFHPSQIGMSLWAEYLWKDSILPNTKLVKNPNPHNQEISEKFGI